ncbi:hypothetical protein CLOSTMETH_03463 [[Clostridium] methylpentosum DSM 5476]|uniref:Uncharacterized protein n=1 Tax=[Clostridium] methylpentosum DSM 5476 TaxID=537013 RepID=C0EHW8_9FIRM|nr:hypothetical protein CLOSTMETH_03463 [[Clostridium] methylpentosum DSM 5476]
MRSVLSCICIFTKKQGRGISPSPAHRQSRHAQIDWMNRIF